MTVSALANLTQGMARTSVAAMTYGYFLESLCKRFPEAADYSEPNEPRVLFMGRDATNRFDFIELTAEGPVWRNDEVGEVPEDWGVSVQSTDKQWWTNGVWLDKSQRGIPKDESVNRIVDDLKAQLKAKGKEEA